jgi:hypothetical protein
MWWIVLSIALVLAAVFASLLVTATATVLSWVPGASLRRWIVIVGVMLLAFAGSLFAVAVYFDPKIIEDMLDPVCDKFEELPRLTISIALPVIVFAFSIVIFSVGGARPQSGVPYQPRAAAWSLRRQNRNLWLLGLAFVAAIQLQDFELRWRLGTFETAALATAQELVPARVEAGDNAAIYYQRIFELKKAREDKEDRDREENPLQGLALCACDNKARQEYIEGLGPIRDNFLAAARCKSCRFDDEFMPVDLLDGMETTYKLMAAAQNMSWYAEAQICQQKPAEAFEIFQALRQFERHMLADSRGSDSVFYFWIEGWIKNNVAQMSAFCDTIPVGTARELIAEPPDVVEYYRRILRWRSAVIRMHVVKALDGRNFLRPDVDNEFFKSPLRRAIGCQGMRLYYAQDELAATDAFFPFLSNPGDPEAWVELGYGGSFPTGEIIKSTWSSSASIGWLKRGQTTQQLTNVGLAATLYHQQQGAWPKSITELVPAYLPMEPRDPSSGELFMWKAIEDGAIAYSIENRQHLEKFDDSSDWWHEAAEWSTDTMFLGDAWRKLVKARLRDPENPCAPDPF